MRQIPPCAYCGTVDAPEREHVIPSCLYPPSRGTTSNVPRLAVPACGECNRGWSDDEAHFRNVLLLAGEPNDAVSELWAGKIRRSLARPDARRRAKDPFAIIMVLRRPCRNHGSRQTCCGTEFRRAYSMAS